MKKVICNLILNRKKKLNGEGKAQIQIEAYLKPKKMYFPTGVYVKPDQWDRQRRRVRNHPDMLELNQHLERLVVRLRQDGQGICPDGFDRRLSREKREGCESVSFVAFMRKEIGQGQLKESTRKNHLSTLKMLVRYCPRLTFDGLTFEFLCSFECYLLRKEYHRNTIAKHMKHVKKYVNLAINKGLMELDKYPFRKYKIKYVESKRRYLTPGELEQLEQVRPSLPYMLRRTLDLFLFCCYTGLRFSDAVRISVENFHLIDDNLWLVYSSVKTEVNVRLPLFLLFDGKAVRIYEYYRRLNAKTLFGVSPSANSTVNKQLKRICRIAGVDGPVSFHASRHTNATILLYNGANITTVQKLLGHRSVRTTEIYSEIMDMTVVRDLSSIRQEVK